MLFSGLSSDGRYVMVMQLLRKSLSDLLYLNGNRFSPATVYNLGIQAVSIYSIEFTIP